MSNVPFFCALGLVVLLIIIPTVIIFTGQRGGRDKPEVHENEDDGTVVIFVTATQRSPSRLADLTSLANTLRHEDDVFWIVVDNNTDKSELLESVIQKAHRDYAYVVPSDGVNNTEWMLRNEALRFIREHSDRIQEDYRRAVVYFGDGDYAYDVRFWDSYVKDVKKLGIWDVGRTYDQDTWKKDLNGSATFRYFDLANFATSLDLLLKSNVTFNEKCNLASIELCFIRDLKLKKSDIEIFEQEGSNNYLVWHAPRDIPKKLQNFSLYNYVVEVS